MKTRPTALLAVAAALLPLGAGGGPDDPGADGPPAVQEACATPVSRSIESAYDRWLGLLGRRGSMGEERFARSADSLVAEMMALDETAARILGDRWREMSEHRRREFTAALNRSIRVRLVSAFEDAEAGAFPRLQAAEVDGGEDGSVRADYWLVRSQTTEPLSFVLARGTEGTCRVVDVGRAGETVVETTRQRVRRLREEYSYAYMIGELGHYGYVVLEDFEDDAVGELPRGWGWKDSDDGKVKPYEVREENGNHYLAARDSGQSVILGKEIRWNLNEYPYVSFRVRVHEIPPGGDERFDRKVDSAAGIYFTYRKKMLGLIPEPVKYVWSSTLPVGAATIRDGVGRPWQIVFGSGREGVGRWHTYVFDLRQAYRDTFGGNPPSTPIGVGVLSDANSVGGHAFADYDEIRALETAPPGTGSGVKQIMESP